MRKILWSLTVAGSMIGGFFAIMAANATSAPQQAAAAALAVSFAVVPYCLARASDEFGKNKE